MAKRDVLRVLEDNEGEWYSINELYDEIDLTESTIRHNMNNLLKAKEFYGVEVKEAIVKRVTSSLYGDYEKGYMVHKYRFVSD